MLQETHFSLKDKHRLKAKGQEKLFHENGNKQTKSWDTILTLAKIHLKKKINK